MFANLKNKLIEEVKASPSKFQQFANAAQAAVSSSSSTTPSGSESTTTTTTANENFFSITEEDTPQNSPYKPLKLPAGAIRGRNAIPLGASNGTGTVPRIRKLSNSSMASDVSFRLPNWDAGSVYHLQSDVDESGSEMGDTASTAAKLDVITKEQLFDAYRKSLDRYHKYRCRYTDLAKKYKDLERDSTKARSVLVETQEKAIRRINELREQCSLEQQAKAHLEEALRIEMDDMQCKMQAYQTKLKLLGENPDNIAAALAGLNEQLIDLSNEPSNKPQTSVGTENSLEVDDFKLRLENYEKLVQERDQHILELNYKLDSLRKQEEENALLLAQTKAAIHLELESKEREVTKLSETIKQLQSETNIKEKQTAISQEELNELKEKLKQSALAKQELEAKAIASDHILGKLKETLNVSEKNVKSFEEKLSQHVKESAEQLQEMEQQNQQLNEMVQRYQQNEVSLAEVDNELNRTKNENNNLKATIQEHLMKIETAELQYNEKLQMIDGLKNDITIKEGQLKQVLDRSEELQLQIQQAQITHEEMQYRTQQLENELKIVQEQNTTTETETISNLKMQLESVSAELNQQLRTLKDQLANKEKELKTLTKKSSKSEKQQESRQTQIQEQLDEIERLKNDLMQQQSLTGALSEASRQREQQMDDEKNELKSQITSILSEISQMEAQMQIVQNSHKELENEKLQLEERIETMERQRHHSEEDTERWRELLEQEGKKLKENEIKLQNVESEHTQMAEKNCLLEENTHRLEMLLAEKERQQTATEEALVSELRLKLETAETSIQRLNDKMQEVLHENSRLHNNQELNDHDYRTLQDKFDAIDKEKAIIEDNNNCLQQECSEMKAKLQDELKKNENFLKVTEENRIQILQVTTALETKDKELKEEKETKAMLEREKLNINDQLRALEATQDNLSELNEKLREKHTAVEELKQELTNLRESNKETMLRIEMENRELIDTIASFHCINQDFESHKEELLLLREEKRSLLQELQEKRTIVESLKEEIEELKSEQESNKTEQQELIELNKKLTDLQTHAQEQELKLHTQQQQSLRTASELESLKQEQSKIADTKNSEMQEISAKLENVLKEKEKLVQLVSNSQQKLKDMQIKYSQNIEELEKVQQKLSTQDIDISKQRQLEIECEYLNNHVKQLETQLTQHQADNKSKDMGTQGLKDKLKSLQCELYVLKENAEKHEQEVEDKEKQLREYETQNNNILLELEKERGELQRQQKHIDYITEQDDSVQKHLLSTQNKLKDLEEKYEIQTKEYNQYKSQAEIRNIEVGSLNEQLRKDLELNTLTIETLQREMQDLNQELQNKQDIQQELKTLQTELQERCNNATTSSEPSKVNVAYLPQTATGTALDCDNLRKINETLQKELEELKHKSSTEISNLQQDMEDLQHTNIQMTDRIMDLERIKAALQAQKMFGMEMKLDDPLPTTQTTRRPSGSGAATDSEKQELETKLITIMAEVQDVSNRNLFLEQKCENYLILEQSNERLKLQNAKLSRQLDETLVSLQHNEGIAANTEFEYLRNIMFQYLTGSANGNNETLVKVISAVLKFSPQQTQVALEKEHQRRSLLSKIL